MIIGITGTNGAGKGAVVNYLVEEKGFTHYSVRDLIIEEVKSRGLELNRINIGDTGTDLRRTHAPTYFTEAFMKKAEESGIENYIIESIRALAEADYIREHGGFVVGVDASHETRYQRITARGSATDNVTLEEFIHQENREYTPEDPKDPNQMNVLGVLEMADFTLINKGTLKELHSKIDVMLIKLATH